jgi:Ca2+:H+ antiporter
MVLSSNHANIILLLLPLAYAGRALHWPLEVVLVLKYFRMLSLSILVSFGTEKLSSRFGNTFAGLMAYSVGNVGTIIIPCVLFKRGEILVV